MNACKKCGSTDLSRPSAPYCRSCRKKIDKEYYERNKKLIRKKRNEDRRKFVEWLRTLKDNKPCTDCGQKYRYWIMHWDHLPEFEKKYNISELSSNVYSKTKVLEEIEKCELVCANCHADRTYKRIMARKC